MFSSRPSEHHAAGKTPVGDRRQEHLRQEAGQEADPDDQAEPVGLDAVLVPKVVEHREHHAVTRREQRGHQTELKDP